MDLKKLDITEMANQAAVLTVKHPVTGEDLIADDGTPVTVTVLGIDSTVMRDELKKRAKKVHQAGKKSIDVNEMEAAAADLLAALTVSWSGIQEDGVTLECDKITVARVYLKYIWLREQVDEFVNERSNFWWA